MPIILQPASPRLLSRDDVRRFMRDFAGTIVPDTGIVNILLDGVEYSNDDIEAGIEMTTNLFNITTPMIGIFQSNVIPKVLLLWGVASHLMSSEAVRQLRNQVSVQDGDIAPIGADDKSQPYLSAAEMFRQRFDAAVKAYKIQLNMSAAFGGMSSGYINTSRSHNA